MRFYLISDNIDTQVGLRLAGIEGEVVNDAAGVEDSFERAIKQTDIGIILVTRLLSDLCPGLLVRLKKEYARPLIIVIPDRHGTVGTDSIAEYVRDAIGIKL